ncbi:MAG: ABC transporter permease [Eubacterium sp.]|nr:ABC transporter permease [Eubacterium sp.]
MKSKTSLFNWAVWKRNLVGGWYLWAALLLLYIMMLPVSVYGTLSELFKYDYTPGELSAMMENVMVSQVWRMRSFVPFFAIVALLCAMYVFSYLFTARNSNMMHTYPVSRTSLFATNFASGMLVLLAPILIAFLLTLAVGLSMGAVNAFVCERYGLWLLTVFVENLFFYSLAVCVLMFVGNMIAVPVLYFILNFLYAGCMIIASAMLDVVCYGLNSNYFSYYDALFSVLTPILCLRRVAPDNIAGDGSLKNLLENMKVLPGYFVAALLLIAAALITYRKKHIETAGDVITVGWLKPVFRWGTAVCTSALGALFISALSYQQSFPAILLGVAVIGILVFFTAQMLLERSVYVFSKRRVRECLVYTVVVCGCYLMLDTDILGIERKIPAADEVEAARIMGEISMLACDADEIDWIRDIHSQILRSKKEFQSAVADKNSDMSYVTIEYLLKNDSIIRREYIIPESKKAESVSEQIRAYGRRPDIALKQIFGIHYPQIQVYGGTWENYTDQTNEQVRISQKDAEKLYAAIVQDVESGELDEVESRSDANAPTMEATGNVFGHLTLDIRDEAGYINAQLRSALEIYHEQVGKDGTTYLSVDTRYTNVLRTLRELGYR